MATSSDGEEPRQLGSKLLFTGPNAVEKAGQYIHDFEVKTNSSFVCVKIKHSHTPVRSTFSGKRIYFQELSSLTLPLAYDGIPFIPLGMETRECYHGPDRHLARKAKAKAKKENKSDHGYSVGGRTLLQTSKKLDCPATIHMRSVVRFPSYKIDKNSDWIKRSQVKKLKSDLGDSSCAADFELCVFLSHEPSNWRDAITHNVDKTVISKIHSLVDDGVRDVGEMSRHIGSFSRQNYPEATELSNRFYPNKKCLRNHMNAALNLSQYSLEDQENLRQNIDKWRTEQPDDLFHFVPSPKNEEEEAQFLFVHQTAWQKRLLSLYGKEICLLDATYSICKSDVSLYFVCVSTNIGYITVGCFLIAAETTENIRRGLQVLKGWNPDWEPSYYMTDFDEKEIKAIESTFQDTMPLTSHLILFEAGAIYFTTSCLTFLCGFHREQAWSRWLTSNVMGDVKKELLSLMRNISNADSEGAFSDAVQCLKASQYWIENERFRVWFERRWLSASQRWVAYYRQCLTNIRVTTTNGLERQHHTLKHKYLKNYTGGTLTSMMTTVVKHFVPDCLKRYRELNVKCMGSSRMYAENLPEFLKNRPKLFLSHCTKRLPSALSIPETNICTVGSGKFTVISEDSEVVYSVDLESSLPNCTCPDWKKTHLPCKHMLSVLLKVPGSGWESLNVEFRNSPLLNIDLDVCSSCVVQRVPKDTCIPKATARIQPASNFRSSPPLGTKAFGSRCKMLSSSIKSLLYLIQKSEDYESVYPDLVALHAKVKSLVPKDCGMLKRPTRRGRKVSYARYPPLKLRRRYRKRCPKGKFPPAQCPNVCAKDEQPAKKTEPTCNSPRSDPDEASKAQCPNVCAKDEQPAKKTEPNSPRSDPDEASKVLREILDVAPTGQTLFQMGPYNITDRSIHYLNSTLSDEVIDLFIHKMPKKNIYHIDCIIMTAIFQGKQETTGYLDKVNVNQYDALIGAINENQNHWVLMVIIPGAKCLVYMNPLGETRSKCRFYKKRWISFMRERHRRGLQCAIECNDWEVQTVPHDRQPDGESCGVYVIRFAEQYLLGQEISKTWSKGDLKIERRRLQLELLSLGEQAENADVQVPGTTEEKRVKKEKRKMSSFYYSPAVPHKRRKGFCVCGQPNDKRLYWECSKCKEWFHPECIGRNPTEIIKGKVFSCPMCLEIPHSECPNLTEVKGCLREAVETEQADPYNDSGCGDFKGSANHVPVFYSNPAVLLFCSSQKLVGKTYRIEQSDWGSFVLLPNEDFADFLVYKDTLLLHWKNLFIIDAPFTYFLHNHSDATVNYLSEEVAQIDSVKAEEYREWLNKIKYELSS